MCGWWRRKREGVIAVAGGETKGGGGRTAGRGEGEDTGSRVEEGG